MTAKPTTITAAEFIDNGYAARIAAREGCKADCTLSMIYVGDFYRDATKRVKARVAAALQAGTEGG